MLNKLKYKKEIDGLRCLAILSVILYHFKFNYSESTLFKGGYIGVDIFYVISGYLITSILLNNLERKKFSFVHFYERRIRRLLPALFIVIIALLPFAWSLLLPLELKKFFYSISFSSFFLSNFFFWSVGDVYGAQSSEYEPLLNTWSLAVEEQFYILYPILILSINNFLKKKFNLYLIIIFVLSLFFAYYFSQHHRSFNFYMIFGRIWELLAGALIAKNENYFRQFKTKKLSTLFSFVGLFFLFVSFYLFADNIKHPSLYTLLPIVGTCLLLVFLGSSIFFNKIFSSNIPVNIGLISYSLYLWHYPIYSFFLRFSNIENSNLNKIYILILTFILAISTYHLVEKPFRNRKFNFKLLIVPLLLIFTLLNVATFFVIKNNGYETRLQLTNFQKDFILSKKKEKEKIKISIKPDFKKKNLLVIGNSHALDFYEILKINNIITKKYNVNLFHIQIRCLKEAIIKEKNDCLRKLDFKSQNLFKNQLKNFYNSDIIVFKTRWNKQDIASLNELNNLKFFKNKEIIIVNSSPEFNFSKENQFKSEKRQNFLTQRLNDISTPINKFIISYNRLPTNLEKELLENYYYKNLKINSMNYINSTLKNKSNNLRIKYYDFFSKICKKKRCKVITQEKNLFSDNNGHITDYGKEFMANKINDFLR